jgi:hypothetical protein
VNSISVLPVQVVLLLWCAMRLATLSANSVRTLPVVVITLCIL